MVDLVWFFHEYVKKKPFVLMEFGKFGNLGFYASMIETNFLETKMPTKKIMLQINSTWIMDLLVHWDVS